MSAAIITRTKADYNVNVTQKDEGITEQTEREVEAFRHTNYLKIKNTKPPIHLYKLIWTQDLRALSSTH